MLYKVSFIRENLAAQALIFMAAFLSAGKVPSFKYKVIGVIHESVIRISAMRATFSKMEECSMTFNSTWQGYGASKAKLAKASAMLFSDLGTCATSSFVNWAINAHTRVRY